MGVLGRDRVHRRGAAEHHRRRPAGPPTTTQGVGDLQDRDRRVIYGAGDTLDADEQVQPPGQHRRVELIVDERAHRRQTAPPRGVDQIVHDELSGTDLVRYPAWVAPPRTIGHPPVEIRAGAGMCDERTDRRVQVGGDTVESVQQEGVVGHSGRHPEHLGVDRGQPVSGHFR